MKELFSHGLIMLIGLYAGWRIREIIAAKNLNDLIEKVNEDMKTRAAENTIETFIEKQGDVFYMYNKKDNSFLVQGKNFSEIYEALSDKYPGKIFSCANEELQKLKS